MTYNLLGYKSGYLTVVKKLPDRDKAKRTQWKCLCLCGNYIVTVTYRLTDLVKPLRTCGHCEWHIKHKESYISWMAMKQRCDDPKRKDYKYYGGRGITYDKSWGLFQNFYIDMGDPPEDAVTGERLSLDRKDVNGNYNKDNCKWSNRSEQQFNKTSTAQYILDQTFNENQF